MTTTPIPADAREPSAARPAPAPLTYTVPVASVVSGLSKSTLYRHHRAGRLHMPRVGGRRLVCAASLRALIGAA